MGYASLSINGRPLKDLYIGGRRIWHKQESEPYALKFTAVEPNATIGLKRMSSSAPTLSLQKSTDGRNWTTYSYSTTPTYITLQNVGDCVYFRANARNSSTTGGASFTYTNRFVSKDGSGKIAASGSLASILDKDGYYEQSLAGTGQYCFAYLFKDLESLTKTPELNAITLNNYCYQYMFDGCSNLQQVQEELPAETGANNCYQGMFRNCTSLAVAPEIRLRYTYQACCSNMFYGCTALVTPPSTLISLGTQLASLCFQYMFAECTSLTRSPSMQIAEGSTGSNSFSMMFFNCTSLEQVTTNATVWGTAYTKWLYGVKATGTFYCPSSLPVERGDSRIPTGWTIVNV